MSDAEVEAFNQVIDSIGDRVPEFFVEGTDRTPENVEATVANLPRPDLIDGRPVDE